MANPGPQASPTLGSFNAAPAPDAERDLSPAAPRPAFAQAVAGGRPYPDPAALLAAVDAAFAVLSWDDIAESMNGHPRIGDRAVRGGMSAAEQSGAAAASRRRQAGARRRQPGLRAALRPYLPDLRQRPVRPGDADQAAGQAGERSGCRTGRGACRTAEDNPPADDEAAGPVDAVHARPRRDDRAPRGGHGGPAGTRRRRRLGAGRPGPDRRATGGCGWPATGAARNSSPASTASRSPAGHTSPPAASRRSTRR